ncbi:Dopey, N-terminal-domain-containing protein [Powellomyces hirtus]|nr:Dopey, N-terminal-domain-containing protein [Powellomyces hirtus]
MADSVGLPNDSSGIRCSGSTEFSPTTTTDSAESLSAHDLQRDPKYRRYVQAVDKILQSFDTISEWADVIGFLTRLAKTLQAYPMHTVIPRKLVLSKRLAQCLNPALPAGVHQKTIEIYAIILEASGSSQMAEDLPLWSHGLFPFLQNSTTTLKPLVLGIYEKFYLPLGPRLKSCLKGLILAILPILEEENGEFFSRGITLLDSLSSSVGQGYFYHCLWLSLISTPHLRLAAVNYLLKRMPKLSSAEDVAVVLGNETGLLARALSAVLTDEIALVQRGGLELLVVHFPLKYGLYQDSDLTLVLQAAVSVVLRKDMSLNRRLYAWLLDSSEGTKLSDKTRQDLALALKSIFYITDDDANQLAKPYKILISLLDKSEVGQPLLQDTLVDIVWSLREHTLHSDNRTSELMQTAIMFMDMVDPSLIFKQCYNIIHNITSRGLEGIEGCQVIEFMITEFKWHDEETQRLHFPFLYKAIVAHLLALPCLSTSLAIVPTLLRLSNLIGAVLNVEVLSHSWPLHDFIDATAEMVTQTKSLTEIEVSPAVSKTEPRNEEGINSESQQILSNIDTFYTFADNREALVVRFHNSSQRVGKHVMQSAFYDLLQLLPDIIRLMLLEQTQGLASDNARFIRDTQSSFIELTEAICTLSANLDPLNREQQFEAQALNGVNPISPFVLSAEPPIWLGPLMTLCYKTVTFPILNAALTCLLSLFSSMRYPIPRPVEFHMNVRSAVVKLWDCLSPDHIAYQSRAVELLWLLSDVSSPYIVEEVIAQLMSTGSSTEQLRNFDRFGVFWRLSENTGHETNVAFSRPLFLLLDALRSRDSTIRRGGETWLRNYVATYTRIVDPLVDILLHESIHRRASITHVDGEEINVYEYLTPFNEAQADYAFKALLGAVRFGDRDFLKSIWTATVKRNDFLKAIQWVDQEYHVSSQRLTYGELLMILSLRYIESEQRAVPGNAAHGAFNESIQIHAAEFLQVILTRSDHMNYHLLVVTQNIAIRKLLLCIALRRLDLQPMLLEVLHAITALIGPQRALQEVGAKPRKSDAGTRDIPSSPAKSPAGNSSGNLQQVRSSGEFPRLRSLGSSPAFVRAVLNAVSTPSNRRVLQHWMDFILSSLPFLRNSFRRLLLPVIQSICTELTRYHVQMSSSAQVLRNGSTQSSTKALEAEAPAWCEQDAFVLLHGLQKMVSSCLGENTGDRDASKGLQPIGGGLRFLTGYVASVFGGDEKGGEGETAQQKMQETVLNMLPRIFRILQELSIIFEGKEERLNFANPSADKASQNSGTSAASFSHVQERIWYRVRRFLNATYKVHPVDTLESLVEVWIAEIKGIDEKDGTMPRVTIDMIESIDGSGPRPIVNTIVEIIRERVLADASPQRGQIKRAIHKSRTLSDVSLILFLEKYANFWMPAEGFSETWPGVAALARDACTQTANYRHLYLPILKVVSVYILELAALQSPEEKRMHREAEELYQKVCDYCTLIAGKAFDQGLWRKTAQTPDLAPEPETPGKQSLDGQNLDLGLPEVERRSAKDTDEANVHEIISYFASHAVPKVRQFLHDQDKMLVLLSNMVYYIITPHFRNKQSSVKSRLNPTLELLSAMAKVPGAQKAWRREAWDGFLDPKFFEMGLPASRSWQTIVQAILSSDKEKVAEIIGRISAVPSTTLFMSKEQETMIRAQSVRRLSFAIFSGPTDQYVPKLPSIQEKLVDIFKSGSGPMVVEAYLCLRVLLCRVTSHHLSNFWPTMLTELIQTIERHVVSSDADKTADTAAFLAACKFLDMVLVLQIEAFQWHQWIFVTESLESLPDSRTITNRPIALIDKLHLSWSGGPPDSISNLSSKHTDGMRYDKTANSVPKQRPILLMRTISDKRELEPFFSSISRQVYQSTYALAKPDLEFLETMLEGELLIVDESAAAAAAAAAAATVGAGGHRETAMHLSSSLLDPSSIAEPLPKVASPQLRNLTLRRDKLVMPPSSPPPPPDMYI